MRCIDGDKGGPENRRALCRRMVFPAKDRDTVALRSSPNNQNMAIQRQDPDGLRPLHCTLLQLKQLFGSSHDHSAN
jgi:hypothetical protein